MTSYSPKFQVTVLFIKWEEANVKFARGGELSGRKPRDCAIAVNHYFCLVLFKTTCEAPCSAEVGW